MIDQNEDGSHTITLHSITCPGKSLFPNTSGVLTWSRETGIRYSLTFLGIHSLVGTEFYEQPQSASRGVGRFVETQLSRPQWIARTDDGTEVKLFGVSETPTSSQTTTSSQTSGTASFSMSCGFHGSALYAVVDIPVSRLLAFENSTVEDFRMFFVGAAGHRHHIQQEVEFQHQDGSRTTTNRCSITLSASPRVSLVSAHSLVKCQPSGWLAFEQAPFTSECEVGAFPEQNFVSFLNGRKVAFYWADRKLTSGHVRRSYFGWMKSFREVHDRVDHQPLPIMDGIEVFEHGETVRDLLPGLFQRFVQRSKVIDFGIALHPLWTAMESVLDDRLALASVSLERTSSIWDECRSGVLNGPPASNSSAWKNKPLLRKLRETLIECLNNLLKNDITKKNVYQRIKDGLLTALGGFIYGESCRSLTQVERTELRDVLTVRVNNLTGIPNSARLRRPFEDLKIPLTEKDNEAIQERNGALHGRRANNGMALEHMDLSAEYFDCIRMLLTKFVLSVCDYEGPYIDYASRPANGNFEVKRMMQSARQDQTLG